MIIIMSGGRETLDRYITRQRSGETSPLIVVLLEVQCHTAIQNKLDIRGANEIRTDSLNKNTHMRHKHM